MCTTVLVETRASLFYLQNTDVNSALHPSGIAESISSFGWGKGGNVTSAGWQVTLCDPMWHVSSRSGVATLRTAIHLLLTYLLTYPCIWAINCKQNRKYITYRNAGRAGLSHGPR